MAADAIDSGRAATVLEKLIILSQDGTASVETAPVKKVQA
jgi:hypothetical protein